MCAACEQGFCACDPCLLLKNDECLLPQLVGKAVRVQVPLAKGAQVRVPQMLSLERFADYLEATILVGICVDESELEEEGPYWLALLSGPAFAVDEDMMHSGQLYRKGWLVARGRWYKLRQRSERGYELLSEEVRASAPRVRACACAPSQYFVGCSLSFLRAS